MKGILRFISLGDVRSDTGRVEKGNRMDEELRKKIARKLLEYDFDRRGIKYGVLADQILKEFESAGYVKLAENQELPKFEFSEESPNMRFGWQLCQQAFKDNNWRKVEL